jgi:predicted nucleic acid-binding protein
MERAGRVVTPLFADWQLAANVVSTIARKDGGFKSKLPNLLNDILIALSARRSGAEVITHNGADFRLVRKHLEFRLRVIE